MSNQIDPRLSLNHYAPLPPAVQGDHKQPLAPNSSQQAPFHPGSRADNLRAEAAYPPQNGLPYYYPQSQAHTPQQHQRQPSHGTPQQHPRASSFGNTSSTQASPNLAYQHPSSDQQEEGSPEEQQDDAQDGANGEDPKRPLACEACRGLKAGASAPILPPMQADRGQYSQAFDESPVDTGKVVVGGPVSMPARKRQRLDEATDKQIDAQLSRATSTSANADDPVRTHFTEIERSWAPTEDSKRYLHHTTPEEFIARVNSFINPSLAAQIFDRYITTLSPHLPAVVFAPNTTAEEVFREKPILYVSILSAASFGTLHPDSQSTRPLQWYSTLAGRISFISAVTSKQKKTQGAYREGSPVPTLAEFETQHVHNVESGLWVKGEPGKGKTMLLCGIINELQSSLSKNALLSYFFCQATDSRINNPTAVLRGLLYMLVVQQPSLVSHIRKRHDQAGKILFETTNSWVALTEIFANVLRDPGLRTTYLVIDALDECVTDRPKLLGFIATHSSALQRVKWIVSGRILLDFEAQLERAGHKVRLSLELDAKSEATTALAVFTQEKVNQLGQKGQYDAEMEHAVLQHLMSNANGTFLWVTLACQDLASTPKSNVMERLASFSPGLDPLYKRMLRQIIESDGAGICRRLLASTAVLYRPVTIPELLALMEPLENFVNDLRSVQDIINLCGSFLTLREDTVYFVHQSAKDFIFTNAFDDVFPDGIQAVR
ncbi:hypothetical protein LTR56_026762 [Elasticomyces elasticus]|nr:hypothetical protein LTR56_026762 [Elasticomyces elasticus]KAK4905028.1 hypothetical protein LTR49_025626 [Elasticomyces elasticus]KAK5736282.1 hypothetical protein LTS12_026233 [Elasticomyces elasticus]